MGLRSGTVVLCLNMFNVRGRQIYLRTLSNRFQNSDLWSTDSSRICASAGELARLARLTILLNCSQSHITMFINSLNGEIIMHSIKPWSITSKKSSGKTTLSCSAKQLNHKSLANPSPSATNGASSNHSSNHSLSFIPTGMMSTVS